MATAPATGQQSGVLLKRTAHPGVYRRGSGYVAIYRLDGRQHRESAATFAEAARSSSGAMLKHRRYDADRRCMPALTWVARHSGGGRDAVREQTREEYRRLLTTFALSYFSTELRLADIDRRALQGFISWLTDRPGPKGRLSDARSEMLWPHCANVSLRRSRSSSSTTIF